MLQLMKIRIVVSLGKTPEREGIAASHQLVK